MDKPLSVLIVGAGFAGLTAAIECANRGMQVTIVEKYVHKFPPCVAGFIDAPAAYILDIFPNGGRVIKAWNNGKVGQEIHDSGCSRIRAMEVYKYDGTRLTEVPWARDEVDHDITYAGHRGKLHSIILNHTKSLVPDVRIGVGVNAYLENDKKAGVLLSTGEILWADCVIAADGPRSIARQQVLGLFNEDEANTNSKWAVFRTFFKTNEAIREALRKQDLLYGDRDLVRFWMCDNLTLLLFVWNKGKDVAWALVHPDDKNSEEGWSNSNIADREHLAKWMKHFTGEDAKTVLDITPEGRTIDFKLVYRPTLDKWTSSGGRTILIGDAAHANLPTAGQGASQAVEDAVTLAHCLESSDGDVRLALEATQRIRYHRSNAVHKSGQANRDAFYKTPWEQIEADPEKFARLRWPKLKPWDPLKFAQDQFPKVAKDIADGLSGNLDELAVPPPEGGFWQMA
ncbi:hypothetical protein CEP52_013438 [Fusarium oligoseptatum]|uniref:FAD-binding domain-containing protein n=1 Tax=Fusarium oligoseptatum TaxID=2604345 RepID=A0A428STK4_9HYPO|nr:hypothetical protein CEP52_013438 [Fusarium oligoseptatum]